MKIKYILKALTFDICIQVTLQKSSQQFPPALYEKTLDVIFFLNKTKFNLLVTVDVRRDRWFVASVCISDY